LEIPNCLGMTNDVEQIVCILEWIRNDRKRELAFPQISRHISSRSPTCAPKWCAFLAQVFSSPADTLDKSVLSFISTMRSRHFSVVAFVLTSLLAWATPASAEWSELVKEDEATYYFDKEAVMPVHVSRYAWVLTDLPKAEKTPTGESYKSMMLRVRMYCKNDTVVRLSVSYFDKQMGKGKEVASDDVHEWRPREYPIRPNTYLAALKKEVCGGSKAAAG